MAKSVLGIVGGSGFYHLPGIKNPRWEKVASPWGEPSDEILFAELDGLPFRFLPRHGRGHRLSPTHINYRANIDALKRAGVTELISLSAVGSLKAELPPGTFVLVDQFIDRTFARAKSFFGTGLVAHVAFGHPVCGRVSEALAVAGQDVAGGALTKFATAVINEREEMVFELSLPIIPQAVYIATRAGVRPIVRTGDRAPGGGLFTAFSTPVLNDAGQVAFVAETDDGRHGIYLLALR